MAKAKPTEQVSIEDLDNCPVCNFQWKGEDVYQVFLKLKAKGDRYWSTKTDAEIKQSCKEDYGWSEDKPVHYKKLIGIELPYDDPNHYDGVSFWRCPNCMTEWDRFTGEKVEKK